MDSSPSPPAPSAPAPASLRVLIADDEPLARQRLVSFLANEADCEIVGEIASGDQLAEAVTNRKPNVVFADVEMPQLSGLEAWRRLPAPRPALVFVTAHAEFAVDAFAIEAADYLLKPVAPARFAATLGRVRTLVHAGPSVPVEPVGAPRYPRRLVLKYDGEFHFFQVDDIIWAQAKGDFIKIHTRTSPHFVRQTLTHFEEMLDPAHFLRIHRSHLVHRQRISKIYVVRRSDYAVELDDGTTLRVSRAYLDSVRSLLPIGQS